MSGENPKPNLRTTEEVLKHLKDKGILKIEVEEAEKVINALLKTAKDFKPENPAMALKMYYQMGQTGLKLSDRQREILFKELTGYEIKDIMEMGAKASEIIEVDAVEIEEVTEEIDGSDVELPAVKKKDDRFLLDIVADAKITNLTIEMVKFGMKSYPKIKGKSTLGNILKGTGLGALALTTIIGGSGAILAARALRLAGKGLKAARGTAAKALHNKALKNMEKTKKGIDSEKKQLSELSEAQRGELDTFFLDHSLDIDKAQKTIQALRGDKILPEDAERIIITEYDSQSLVRDTNLTRIVNFDTLEIFEQAYGIDPDKMADFISRITVDKEGKLEFPEGTDIDVKQFNEDDMNLLSVAVSNESIVMGAQESSKLAISNYVEFKDGVIVVKEGVDLTTLPLETARIVKRMENKKIPEDLFAQVINGNDSITALIMCEQEILTNVAIEANREMSEIYADRGEIVTDDKKGVIKSSVEAITAASLHAKAKGIVERRIESHIQESITRNGGASESLLALAREKLIQKDEVQIPEHAPEKNNGQVHNVDDDGSRS